MARIPSCKGSCGFLMASYLLESHVTNSPTRKVDTLNLALICASELGKTTANQLEYYMKRIRSDPWKLPVEVE